jgi:hypothetical protein
MEDKIPPGEHDNWRLNLSVLVGLTAKLFIFIQAQGLVFFFEAKSHLQPDF